jgi:predicted nucleic acid-binding protein
MPGSFFDTNVLVYLTSADPGKAARTRHLLAVGGTISVQVLNETANVARRKLRLSWLETLQLLDFIRGLLAVVAVTVVTHEKGMALARRYNLPVYDAIIAASAIASGCDMLWLEDFQHGMLIDGSLRVMNPFVSG